MYMAGFLGERRKGGGGGGEEDGHGDMGDEHGLGRRGIGEGAGNNLLQREFSVQSQSVKGHSSRD